MFEAEYKAQLIKITSLEQELANSKNDKKSLESEFELFKRKKAEELRVNMFSFFLLLFIFSSLLPKFEEKTEIETFHFIYFLDKAERL